MSRVLNDASCMRPYCSFMIRLVVPAQAVIHGQLPAHLPAVLDEKTQGVITEPGVGGRVEVQDVGEARKEAGIAKTGRVGPCSVPLCFARDRLVSAALKVKFPFARHRLGTG